MPGRLLSRVGFAVALFACAWGPLAQGSAVWWSQPVLVLLGTAALGVTALAALQGARVQLSMWMGVAVMFMLWNWASVAWAPDRASALGAAGVWTGVLGVAVTLAALVSDARRVRLALLVMLGAGSAAVGLAGLQAHGVFVPGFSYYAGVGEKYLSGPYFNPSHFSGYLVPVAALAMTVLLFTRAGVHSAALVLLLGGLLLVNLRTDASAVPAVLLAVVTPVLLRAVLARSVPVRAAGVLGVIAVAGVMLVAFAPAGRAVFETHRQALGIEHGLDRFMLMRRAVWRYGLEMWEDHAWTGVGAGQFATETTTYRAAERAVGAYVDGATLNYAHSDALQVASETGVVGLALFATLLLLPVLSAVRERARRSLFTLGWIAAFPAVVFAGVFDGHASALPGTMVTVFALCGLAVAGIERTKGAAVTDDAHRAP